jgi:putative flavoprotein involved in K+ transport
LGLLAREVTPQRCFLLALAGLALVRLRERRATRAKAHERLARRAGIPPRGESGMHPAEQINVVVIGAGQAGLATSRELKQAGVEHVVLERSRLGQTWRGRWDSFCLVTPNWTVRLPGHPYDGADPDGYMRRDEIVAYLGRYAGAFDAPLREGVEVTAIETASRGGFLLETPVGQIYAESVVLATGAYQRPYRPPVAAGLPADILQLDVEDYRRPDALPDGRVLVIGSGQSGCQIAEELKAAGREVFLACGRAPWLPRRIGGRDFVWWALETGFLDQPLSALTSPAARLAANLLATGRDGGHDLHIRTLQEMGVELLGHFTGVEGHAAQFALDLAETVGWGDRRYREFMGLVRKTAEERGLATPDVVEPGAFDDRAPTTLDLRGFGALVFAGGFRPDYRRWVHIAGAFDELGFPIHDNGASVAARGLYFVGVHFLRTRKSSLLCGVGEDAALVARQIAAASGT